MPKQKPMYCYIVTADRRIGIFGDSYWQIFRDYKTAMVMKKRLDGYKLIKYRVIKVKLIPVNRKEK